MPAPVTALLVGAKVRPPVDTLAELVTALWEEDVVSHRAALSVGPVTGANAVVSATAPGKGREVRWKGDDLPGLLAALRAAYDQDVAIWFASVDMEAFEPAEEEEYEDVEDEGDDDGEDDDAPAARPGVATAASQKDDGLGEFDIVPPSLCLYSVRSGVDLGVKGASGARAAWVSLHGEDVDYVADDLGDSMLRDVIEDSLGDVKIGKLKG